MGASGVGRRNNRIYTISWSEQIGVFDSSTNPVTTTVFFICDDCDGAYLAPRYYTFEKEACHEDDEAGYHLSCTENLCPDCAGPDLEPDEENDPRRPSA